MADCLPVLSQDGVDVEEIVRDGADQPVHLTVVQNPHPDAGWVGWGRGGSKDLSTRKALLKPEKKHCLLH